jgi:uncharacterized protein (TIGR00369 family)
MPMPTQLETPAAALQRWHDEEAAVRRRLREPGVARSEQVAGKSGLEVFQAIFDGELPTPPMGATLDFVPIRIERGLAVFQGRPGRAHYNPMGTVHGGWFATLLDSCVGCAIHSALPAGSAYATLELKLNLIRALTDKVALVRAEGRIIHLGRSTATAEGRLVDHAGTLYAHATTTCIILEAPKARDDR